jgi:hypothetical protein
MAFVGRVLFFSILLCSHNGDHPQEELAKFWLQVSEENRILKESYYNFDNFLEQ